MKWTIHCHLEAELRVTVVQFTTLSTRLYERVTNFTVSVDN